MKWLPTKFPKARILSVSYDANLALKSSTSGSMDLYPFGESLVQEMVLPGVGIGQNGCPVVFVCHCLGGLIAKQIIVIAHEKFKVNKKIYKLLRSTKAFFFYATPHGGSKLVQMNLEIGRLNSRFQSIQQNHFHNEWKFSVVAEAHATIYYNWLFNSMNVEEHSARYVYDHVMHVAADHFDVCRPECTENTNFLHLTACISEVVSDYECSQAKVMELPDFVVEVDDKLAMLCKKLENNPIMGLVGMGGIGKTTLSKIMYNSEREHYEMSCFLEDVKSCGNLVVFQKQLFRELCGGKWDDNENVKYHLRQIQDQIKERKVLIGIDDVGTEKNLEDLQVLDALKEGTSGSRLVITCRDRAILKDHMSDGVLEVDGLNDDQAMQLFSHYAFHEFDVDEEMDREDIGRFEDQAVKIVKACAGLPLTLEVIGQHLRRQNRLNKEERMEMWKEALQRLKAADSFVGHQNADEKLWATLKLAMMTWES